MALTQRVTLSGATTNIGTNPSANTTNWVRLNAPTSAPGDDKADDGSAKGIRCFARCGQDPGTNTQNFHIALIDAANAGVLASFVCACVAAPSGGPTREALGGSTGNYLMTATFTETSSSLLDLNGMNRGIKTQESYWVIGVGTFAGSITSLIVDISYIGAV